jgi:hypothetical protein
MPLTEEERKERQNASNKRWRERNKQHTLAYSKKYYQDNKEVIKAYASEYHQENKEKRNARSSEWRRGNQDKIKQQRSKYRGRHAAIQNKYTKEMRDCYIKRLLTRDNCVLSHADIPQSLIDAKRIELQMKRYFKEQENG